MDDKRSSRYSVIMHIYFSGIGGAGIGPLAQIAKQAGYQVSGSDKQNSSYIEYLKKNGISDIVIGQTEADISAIHQKNPIDWLVYTSALPMENPNAPELVFCKTNGIKNTKRDDLLNKILEDKKLKLIAIAGTHGKTTTTALTTWLFKQLDIPVSYILPAKTNFADMGAYDEKSEYFIYEADEFDRNFLAYSPHISLITGVTWDHHEIFLTRDDYKNAFKEFIEQSETTYLWQEDYDYLQYPETPNGVNVLGNNEPQISDIKLLGKYNRQDAWLAMQAAAKVSGKTLNELIYLASDFPGLSRRMELIAEGLYSDYAHTPEKITGAMSVASEMAKEANKKLVVVYEPLTNRRQHFMKDDYKDCFKGAEKVYWIPSYLAREDPSQIVLEPKELITHLADPSIALAMERDEKLLEAIKNHLSAGDMVVAMAGGGGNSLDEWLRKNF